MLSLIRKLTYSTNCSLLVQHDRIWNVPFLFASIRPPIINHALNILHRTIFPYSQSSLSIITCNTQNDNRQNVVFHLVAIKSRIWSLVPVRIAPSTEAWSSGESQKVNSNHGSLGCHLSPREPLLSQVRWSGAIQMENVCESRHEVHSQQRCKPH